MNGAPTVELVGEGIGGAVAGGKGSALDRLVNVGAEVPPTGVITTAAYHEFIGGSGLESWLEELRGSEDGDPRFDADTVDKQFLAAPMSDSLRIHLFDLAGKIRGNGLLAVRSSATAEDLANASFAGQYRSLLEIGDHAELERAVRLVWASLWHPAPRAYRRFAAVDEDGIAMAVVVMQLVAAQRAGVVFTVSPTGRPDQLRVEAVDGLAEQLVSGEVTPDAYELPRQAGRYTPFDPVIDEVVSAAMAIERDWGQPVDVEWAHDGDRLFVVQARPITTIADQERSDPFDTRIGGDDSYTTAGIAEMLPGVLPPLQWTTVAPLLEEGFRTLFEQMDALPETAGEMPFLARIRGRATLSLDLMRAAALLVPGGSAQELERQYFGRVVSSDDELSPTPKRGPFKGLRNMGRSAREIAARRRFRFEADATIETIREIAVDPVDVAELTDEQLLAYRHRLLDIGGRAVAAEVAIAAAAAAAYRGVELFLEPHIGAGEAALAAQQLTAGGIEPCGARLTLNTCLLTALAMVDPDVTKLLLEVDGEAATRSGLSRHAAGRELLERFDEELSHAGSSAVFAGSTWAESEGLGWQLLRQSIELERMGTNDGVDAETRIDRLRNVQQRFGRSVKYRVQRALTGQLVDGGGRMLKRLVFDAVDFLDKREGTKSAILRLGGGVRRVHLEVGSRLQERGLLPETLDVDLLDAFELEESLAGRPISIWELEQRRSELESAEMAGHLAQVFTGDPDHALTQVAFDGDSIVGWAASPGRYEGTARVISKSTEPLGAGEILVARTTDPSWTPLFLTAGAIVVEEGGPLSHAAIIARELGLPAVLNVPGLIERLGQSEARLLVDGSSGSVEILETAPSDLPEPASMGAT
jgi:phosphohistidine swiveling domain-containing protein